MSRRTIYRDIAELSQRGVSIHGAPGRGYWTRPDALPVAILLNAEDVRVLLISLQGLKTRGDTTLNSTAKNLAARIAKAQASAGRSKHELRRVP